MSNETTTWSPADITSIVNIGLTFICVLINIHQSYAHKHFHSECLGCVIDNEKSRDKSMDIKKIDGLV